MAALRQALYVVFDAVFPREENHMATKDDVLADVEGLVAAHDALVAEQAHLQPLVDAATAAQAAADAAQGLVLTEQNAIARLQATHDAKYAQLMADAKLL